jgi:hypothetical protein
MAHIQVGDTVQYLNDVGGGIVTKIISPGMVEIKDDSGFEIPVAISELLLTSEKKTEKPQSNTYVHEIAESPKITIIPGNDNPQMYLAIVPNTKQANVVDFYIINDSNYWILFTCSSSYNGSLELLDSGSIEPNIKIHIGQFSLSDITHMQNIVFQGIIYDTEKYSYYSPIDVSIPIQHKKLYTKGVFQTNDFFDEDAWITELYDNSKNQIEKSLGNTNLAEILNQKESVQSGKRPRIAPSSKQKKDEIREIDLHIHELIEDEYTVSKEEMLTIQIQAFEAALHQAIKDNINKLVCIHGVGNGVLKTKIQSILDTDYPHLFYQDASFQKYKFGATVIYFRKIYK